MLDGWRHVLALHRRTLLIDELKAAERAFKETMTEESLHRFVALKRLVEESERNVAALDGFDGIFRDADPT